MRKAIDLGRDFYALSNVMDFDHVVTVHDDGTVSDDESGLYAPDVYMDSDLTVTVTPGWELLNGYSGQDRYSGPVMHESEFIGGGMARDILSEPGEYVAVIVYSLDTEDDGDDIAGWAVARWIGE